MIEDAVWRDHKRFAQLVRKLVRDHVREEREAPGLTLWVSSAGDPRAAAAVRIGAAHDVADVRFRAVEAIEDAGAYFAAIGRGLAVPGEEGVERTSNFGLIVFGRGTAVPLAWKIDVVAGRAGGWREWVMSPASRYAPFLFVQAALDRVMQREKEDT